MPTVPGLRTAGGGGLYSERTGFAHAVALEHRCTKCLLEAEHDAGVEAARSRADEAQPSGLCLSAVRVDAVQNRPVHREASRIPGRSESLHAGEERRYVELCRADDASPDKERTHQRRLQSVTVEHRHDVDVPISRAQVVVALHGAGIAEQDTRWHGHKFRQSRAAGGQQHKRHVVGTIPVNPCGRPLQIRSQ